MAKLQKYAETSTLLEINISFGEESFHFNLFKELIISEEKINEEAIEQASSYAFLSMLHTKVLRVAKDKKAEMEKIYAKKYVNYKTTIDPDTKRPYPKETAKEMATKNPTYQEAIRVYHQAEEEASILWSCVKAFEQRKDLIQTLSANLRKNN